MMSICHSVLRPWPLFRAMAISTSLRRSRASSLSCSALNYTSARDSSIECLPKDFQIVQNPGQDSGRDREHGESDSRSRKSSLPVLLWGAISSIAASLTLVKYERPSSIPNVITDLLFKSRFTVHAAESFESDKERKSSAQEGGSEKSRRQSFNFIADVVQEVASSLVYIEIKDLGARDFFTGVPVTSSNGSGFIVREDGLILTNAHVVINKPRALVQVRLQDGRTFTGVVEDVDMKSDLATVRIPCKGLPKMPLGKSSTVRPGEFVIAMGSPLSLSNTITTGVVSAPCRQRSELGLRGRDVPEYIQTDAAITFGNSGGPLVNLDGEAIGINSMKVTPGISFAIPIDYAKDFLKRSEEAKAGTFTERKSSQTITPGDRRYMGITMLTINPQILEELRSRLEFPPHINHGIVIFRIVRGSPADVAGLLPGDIVTEINGVQIYGSKDVYKLLEKDDPLTMKIHRRNKELIVKVQPEQP